MRPYRPDVTSMYQSHTDGFSSCVLRNFSSRSAKMLAKFVLQHVPMSVPSFCLKTLPLKVNTLSWGMLVYILVTSIVISMALGCFLVFE